jgi:antitoxin VapB
MAQTTVFQSGNSQAVRLPKAFRFRCAKVEIFRRGEDVVLRQRRPGLGEAFDLLAELASALPMGELKDRRPPEQRDWSNLWTEPKHPVARKKRGRR